MLQKVINRANDAMLILKEGLLYNNIVNSSMILLYHRVFNYESDPQLLAVSIANFREQMQYLKDNFQIISLEKLTTAITGKKVPQNAVAITFDDGYADNYYFMKPILEELDIPATIFITTSLIDSERELWWDELEQVFLLAGELPDHLDLRSNGYRVSLKIGDSAGKPPDRKAAADKKMISRKEAYFTLHSLVKKLDYLKRNEVMEFLFNWARKKRACRKYYRTMNADEISDLHKGGLIEIGAHTHTHSALSYLSSKDQKEEILTGKIQLENITNSRVTTFAYPFGSHLDYNKNSVLSVREAGFSGSYSNFPLKISRRSDIFQQPRFLVRDWNGDEFATKIRRFSNGLWN